MTATMGISKPSEHQGSLLTPFPYKAQQLSQGTTSCFPDTTRRAPSSPPISSSCPPSFPQPLLPPRAGSQDNFTQLQEHGSPVRPAQRNLIQRKSIQGNEPAPQMPSECYYLLTSSHQVLLSTAKSESQG